METGIHELTAGYALDALDPDERSRVRGAPPGCEQLPAGARVVLGDDGGAGRRGIRARADARAPRADPRGRARGAAAERRRARAATASRSRPSSARSLRSRPSSPSRSGSGHPNLSSQLDETRAALERQRAAAAVLVDPGRARSRCRRARAGSSSMPTARRCSWSTVSILRPRQDVRDVDRPGRKHRSANPAGTLPGPGRSRDRRRRRNGADWRRRRGDGRAGGRRRRSDDSRPIVASGPRLNRQPLRGIRPPGARLGPLAGSEREGDAASAAPGSQASACGAAVRPLRRSRLWRSRSVSSAPSRARSPRSTRRRSASDVDTVVYAANGRTRSRRAPRRREPRPRRHRGHRADHAPGDRLGRGSALLRAQRHRRARRRARALAGRPPAGHRRGRLDDHAAVRQERVHPERADTRAQGARGGARLAARAALEQGSDPHRVPQHDLLRPRRVRHPAGGARVLQEEREGARRSPSRPSSPEFLPILRSTTRRSTRGARRCGGATCSG